VITENVEESPKNCILFLVILTLRRLLIFISYILMTIKVKSSFM